MTKKYLVFIASSPEDLKNERRELPRIISELGHIPVMADYFDLQDKNSSLLVQRTIEDCDYFVILAAHRYLPETEYAWAVKKGIPVIALIIDEKARWKAAKKEKDPALIKKLETFKEKLRESAHAAWTNAADLRQKAQSLIIQETNLNPRTGWVRADQAADPAVANELSRLFSENEDLKRQIRVDGGEVVAKIRSQMRHALRVLALNYAELSFYYTSGTNWENTRKFRYLKLFKLLVPELSLGKTTAEISRFLGKVLNPDLEKTVRGGYPTPSNTIKKIMADFSLLKLVKYGAKRGSGEEAWEITEYGKELYAACRMRQLERPFAKKGSSGPHPSSGDKKNRPETG